MAQPTPLPPAASAERRRHLLVAAALAAVAGLVALVTSLGELLAAAM